jgi:hypothetical protein
MTSEIGVKTHGFAKAFDSQRRKKTVASSSDTQAPRELYGGLRKKFPCLIFNPLNDGAGWLPCRPPRHGGHLRPDAR